MTRKEQVQKNISLTFQFIRYLINNPKEIKKLPDNSDIMFFEDKLPIITKKKPKSEAKKTVCYEVNKTFHPVNQFLVRDK
jgi:hypothetical protein